MSFRVFLENENLGNIELQVPHVNWQDANRDLERVTKYKGIIISYAIALEFTKDARSFIQQAYEIYGQNTDVFIKIYELNYEKSKYEIYFEGVLDLSTYVIKELTLEVDAIDDRDIQKILNNDELEINILSNESINGTTLSDFVPFLRDVKMHSQILEKIFFKEQTEAVVQADSESPLFNGDFDEDGITEGQPAWVFFPQFSTLTSDDDANDYTNDEIPNYPIGISEINPESIKKFILQPEYDGNYDLTFDQNYNITVGVTNGQWDEVRIEVAVSIWRNRIEEERVKAKEVINGGDVLYQPVFTFDEVLTSPISSEIYNISYNQTINIDLKKGDRVYLASRVYLRYEQGQGEDPVNVNMSMLKNIIDIKGKTTMPETTIKAVYEHDAISRVIDLILGRNGAFKSEFLGRTISYGDYSSNGQEISCMLTNGSWLRGSGNGQMVFKLSDLFMNINKKYNLGFIFDKDINGQLIVKLEPISEIYKNQEIINIGKVVDLIKKVDNSRQYNSVKIGNKKEGTENARTDSDFTNPKNRKMPIESLKNELDLVGNFITNGSIIEELRRNLFLPIDDQDDKKDDDIFQFITYYDSNSQTIFSQKGNEAIIGDDSYLVFDSISSSKDLSTAYNLRLMPYFLYKKYYGGDIRAMFQKQIDSLGLNYTDFFLSGIDLNDLEIVENGITYKENGNNSINDYPSPIWLPEIYIFDKDLTFQEVKKIANNRIGFITFEDRIGNKKQGFLISVSISDESRIKKCGFELLRKY